jgi:hypothetical protein
MTRTLENVRDDVKDRVTVKQILDVPGEVWYDVGVGQ